jgi:hypothetical protein
VNADIAGNADIADNGSIFGFIAQLAAFQVDALLPCHARTRLS